VEIATRAGAFSARLAADPHVQPAFVVELLDLNGQPETCLRAVAALLLAASGSMRSVKGGLVDHGGGATAMLLSPLDGPLERSTDEALSALAAACRFTAREARALLDEPLAVAYLARAGGPARELAPGSINQQEEHICLQ
jgi:hypothetical protein